jgi:DNA polymerase-1
MHTATAMLLTGKPKEEITKEDRSYGKSMNFAIIYGTSEYGLAHNFKISIDKGKQILADFYRGYPVLASFKTAVEKMIMKLGYSITPLGRRRYFDPEPDFADSKELARYRGRLLREGFNMIIQGGGADITKQALVDLFYKNPYGDKFKLLLQVHDEIVAEVDDSIVEEASIWMQSIMEEAEQVFLGELPAKVDASVGQFWVH